MALIKCKECGKEISATALICPHCGFPNKKKSKRVIIVIVIVLVIFLLAALLILFGNFVKKQDKVKQNEEQENVNVDGYKNIDSLSSLDEAIYGDNSVILLSQTTCSYCKQFKPVLERVKNDYNLDVYEIVLDELDDELVSDMMNSDNEFGDFFYENSDWGTPLLSLFQDGELVDSVSGYTEEASLVEILKDNNFI